MPSPRRAPSTMTPPASAARRRRPASRWPAATRWPTGCAAMTHDLLAAAGADRRLTWTNPAWQPLLGWTAEELRADSYHGLVHPDDLERVVAFERELLAQPRRRAPGDRAAAARPRRQLPLAHVQRQLLRRRRARLLLRQGHHRPPAGRGGAARGRGALPRGHRLDARRRSCPPTASGRIIFWNAGAEAMFGSTRGRDRRPRR